MSVPTPAGETWDRGLRGLVMQNLDKPHHGDIYSARLLVLMADQDGEDIEPELRALAAIRLGNNTDAEYDARVSKLQTRASRAQPCSHTSPAWAASGFVLGVLIALVLKLLGVW